MSTIIIGTTTTNFKGNGGGVAPPSPTELGTLYSENWGGGNLNNYAVNNGAGTISLNAGVLRMTGAAGGITSNIQFNNTSSPHQYTMLEKWKQRVRFVANTPSSTSFGFSIGVMSANGFTPVHSYARLAQDNSATLGQFYVYSNVNGAITQTTNGSFTLVGGTTYVFEVERVKNQMICKLFAADGVTEVRSSYTATYNITTQNASSIGSNVGRFCLINHGGTNDIIDWTVTSSATKNASVLHLGASNVYGMFAGSNADRYVEKGSTQKGVTYEVLAGYDQGTAAFLLNQKEIIALNGQRVHLNIMGNDVAAGVPNATYEANYSSLVTAIKGAGSTVFHGCPICRTGVNMPQVSTWLSVAYPLDVKIDFMNLTKNGLADFNLAAAYNIGDGTHMNPTGHQACADLLDDYL